MRRPIKTEEETRHGCDEGPNQGAQERDESDRSGNGSLTRKAYERELGRLHGELVKLQQWVVAKGLKVVIVFEG